MDYTRNILLFFILLIVSFAGSVNCRLASLLREKNKTVDENYFKNISDLVGKLMIGATSNKTFVKSTSERCRNNLRFSFGGVSKNLTEYFAKKILLDSSKNKNDVSTFKECMEKKYYYFDEKNGTYPFYKSTYMIANVKLKHMKNITMSDYNDGDYVLGFCVPKVCNSTEFKALFFQIETLLSQVLHVNGDEDLEITLLDNEDAASKFNWSDSFYLFVFGIETAFFLIVLFNFVPFSVLKCFFKTKEKAQGDSHQ